MRGGKNPLLADDTSSIAELSGGELSLLIPTCASKQPLLNISNNMIMEIFLMEWKLLEAKDMFLYCEKANNRNFSL